MIFRKNKNENTDEESRKIKKEIKHEDDFEWDKKRVAIALIVLVVGFFLLYEIKNNFFDDKVLGDEDIRKSEIEKPKIKPPVDLSNELETTFDEVRKSVLNLSPEEVATTSPQIQKVLRDIEGIKNLPQNEAKEACHKICSEI